MRSMLFSFRHNYTPPLVGRGTGGGGALAMKQREFRPAIRCGKRLRKTPTHAERAAWRVLRKLPGMRFRRQAPLGPYVFDFVDHGAKLIVEIDGGVHRLTDVQARDARKEAFAEDQGCRVVRVSNDEAVHAHVMIAKLGDVRASPRP